MNKLMNKPDRFVDEMLEGLCAAIPSLVQGQPGSRVVRAAHAPKTGKVGIVSGGGSGHLPLFTGYVGRGLIDACAVGDVFAGPSVDSCSEAIRSADGGRGVLCLYGNYGGDRMSFDMARDIVGSEGIATTSVRGTDDIASAPQEETDKRRGVAGLVYAYKIAGARADRGGDLQDVTRVAEKAVASTRTIGCALAPCQIPGASEPTFSIDGQIEMGMGIHGEPGIWRKELGMADDIADEMVERLLDEAVAEPSHRVSVMVNSLGATSLEELFILYRRIAGEIDRAGLEIVSPLIGRWVTSMEMAGASLSLVYLDEELEGLLGSPCACPFWVV